MQRRIQQFEVIRWRLLGQLDHDLAGRNAERLQQFQSATGLVRGVQQGFRRGIEEQFARQMLLAVATTGVLAAEHLQVVQATAVTCRRQQVDR